MAENKGMLVKLMNVFVVQGRSKVTSSTTRRSGHGCVRLEATQRDASQQYAEEEPSSLWRAVCDDHGRRLICTRPVYADEVRTAGPQDFESASQANVLPQNVEIYAESSGLERARTRPRESKEKVRHPPGIFCKCFLLLRPDLSDLPPACL